MKSLEACQPNPTCRLYLGPDLNKLKIAILRQLEKTECREFYTKELLLTLLDAMMGGEETFLYSSRVFQVV